MKKQYTPQDVIRWLKRNYKARSMFGYWNHGSKGCQVCLFSRFIRSATGNKELIVTQGGGVRPQNIGSLRDTQVGVIPFHDTFWRGRQFQAVNRDEAIQRLKELV